MSDEEDLDILLDTLERRAGRLTTAGNDDGLRESDGFQRVSAPLSGQIARGPRAGDRIGENYEVVDVVDHTAASSVLVVKHRAVDRLFAMKLLPRELSRDSERVERFQEEARATSMIGHENIVFVTDFGKSTRFGHYFVMEYLDGQTLASLIEATGPQTMDATLAVAVCAGSALAAVHELGIVHCDVCPKNLMSHGSNSDEMWKLLDFGLSNRVVDPTARTLGYQDAPLYVAPEVALGTAVDHRADQFSLAAVLYHMLVGQPPWPERTWTQATPDHWTRPAPMPAEQRDDVSRFIDQVLLIALNPNPAERHPNVETFVEKFQRASGRSRRPTIPPIDVRDAAHSMTGAAGAAKVTFGTSFDSEASEGQEVDEESLEFVDPPSVEISLDMLPNMRPKITMAFQHAQRLRREWRRNLVSGGLFVPTVKSMARGTAVVAVIHFAPTGQEAGFPARILEYSEPSASTPGGLAIQIDEQFRDALHGFLHGLDLGLLTHDTVVIPLRRLTATANISANEAFFLTRVTEPMPVGRLRAMFASLPLDLDEVVASLQETGWLDIEGPGGRRKRLKSNANLRAEKGPGEVTARADFVRLTLERADYFRSQGNFLAEIETLELAGQRTQDASLYYRAGLTRIQFLNDFAGARLALDRACELEPQNPKYTKALAELERLSPK